ncbi:hypothetical protein [Sunxiuqinia indica]|uniref:hypothetical protein n=1 Tax=Sunxiuqinia indica TaxID=2692584 RepID=UPI0013597211|nr:hypothetical protein [Sunxiuqinia indica]
MDKNTVLLSVEDYNALRDFKKEITDGNVLVEYYSFGFGVSSRTRYYTNDEVAKELHKKNDNLKNKIKDLENRIKDLENPKPKETTIDEIKKMSVWQFLKWKRG